MPSRRVSTTARLSPLQPGRRATRRGARRALVATAGGLIGIAAALAGELVSPLVGAGAALGVMVVVGVLAVLFARR